VSPRIAVGRLKNPVLLLGLGFGSGLSPRAPGTAGSFLALMLAVALPQLTQPLVVLGATLAGIYLCHASAELLGVHDHPGIVWDEFCGLWLTLMLIPVGLASWAAAFVLFRIFDIFKPWPISWCDRRLRGGFGIMFDDILAGLAAGLLIQAGFYLLTFWRG